MNLSYSGVIAVEGEDRRSFLQGQLSNDLQSLSPIKSQLAALSNPQGRVVSILRLVEIDNAICLLLPDESVQSVMARLQLYVLRAKVTLTDHSNKITVLGIIDNKLINIEKHLAVSFPPGVGAVAAGPGVRILRIQGEVPRWLMLLKVDQAAQLASELAWAHEPGHTERWMQSDLEAGLPTVHTQTQEMFLPQMLNLDLLDGISFTKGCYTGQEIIARTQNLGRIKRRMLRFSTDAAERPKPGDPIYAGQDKAGYVLAAVPSELGWQLLAVIKLSLHEHSLSLDDKGNDVLTSLPLPYAIPELDT